MSYDTNSATALLEPPTTEKHRATERDVLEQVTIALAERYEGRTARIIFGYDYKSAMIVNVGNNGTAHFQLGEEQDDTIYAVTDSVRVPLDLDQLFDKFLPQIDDDVPQYRLQ